MYLALIEDDPDQSDVLGLWLSDAGYSVTVFPDGAAVLAEIRKQHFDMFVVDWILPDMNGGQIIQQIREQLGWKTPILVASARDTESDIVMGLNAGADDYVTKPIRQLELIARIGSLARRVKARKQPVLRVGNIELDSEQQIARLYGVQLTLTQKEFDLAWYLFSNPGRLFSRHHLLDKIWGMSADVDTRTVDTHVSRLRRKFSLAAGAPWNLESVYGYGYRMTSAG
jgi:two-component system, OmpR family, response regulator RegX3